MLFFLDVLFHRPPLATKGLLSVLRGYSRIAAVLLLLTTAPHRPFQPRGPDEIVSILHEKTNIVSLRILCYP
ncbi:hypothetical protein GQ53DRAFT_512005 [Thozetella sp. PMI_491]|nr:hypothetical protein GQ53DRAFT_512005 [Thozetella sp. PMI_491]